MKFSENLIFLKIIAFEIKALFSVNYDKNELATVNVWRSGPKISYATKGHHKQLNLFDINVKLA